MHVSVDLTAPRATSQFSTGASHTQNDIALGQDTTALTSARPLISSALVFENIPIMGWGSPDPEPAPGIFNWTVLDQRIEFVRSTKTTKMITLCCAPGWMHDPQYPDDWKNLEARPAPAHYQDFAKLAGEVAKRYPDVQYFQVWNELKGFYNGSLNRWDYEGYSAFYNLVYDAVKAVRPEAKLGGPYVVVDHWASASAGGWPAKNPALRNQPWGTADQRPLDVISYWLEHKHGADFILVDGGTSTREGRWLTDGFGAANFFPALMDWIRQQPSGGATLPVAWAEWYPNPPRGNNDSRYREAVFAHALISVINSGYAYALLWGTQGNSGLYSEPNQRRGNNLPGQIQSTATYEILKMVKEHFGPGTILYKVTSSSTNLTVMSSKTKTMLVNHLGTPQNVSLNNKVLTLTGYQVLLSDTPGN